MRVHSILVPAALYSLLAPGAHGIDVPSSAPAVPLAPLESFTPEQTAHWAYHPLARVEVPSVGEPHWSRSALDRFILSALEEMELPHSPEASRVDLIRRVTFDLTGLPPSPDEVAAFVSDSRTDAYERVVDRLLASPHFSVRWAQHWLDLAHYADTNGFELDADRPDAWRYRDWVVAAMNGDMPYDRFASLQLAGDEVAPGDPSALIATGFARSGPREVVAGNIDPQVRRQNELTEATTTVGSVFLGLTVGCARCHDHKFDAFPTTDYYRLQSYFEGAVLDEILLADRTERAAFDEAKQALDARIKPLKDALAKLEASYREKLKAVKQAGLTPLERAVMATPEDERTPVQKKLAEGVKKALTVAWEEVAEAVSHNAADHAERERLKRAIHDVEVTLPPPPARAMAMVEKDRRSPETFVLTRGDAKHRGARVEPRPPGVLLAVLGYPDVASARKRTIAVPPCCATTSGRRRELAAWLTHPRNALVARVIVNRLWQHHFGLGIVATPSDFGVRGEPPSHPELLDWLARELTERSFSLKALHRMIVLSSTYRQSSHDVDPQLSDGDPENQLLGRMRRRRMEAEGIRDAFLEVSGRLQSKMGGPGIRPPIENEVRALIFTEAEVVDLWPETPDPSEHARRSLYLYRKRNVRYPLFDAFDAPDTQISCPRREVSTHALQPLVLLNSAFAIDCAKAFAGRLLAEARTPRQRMDRAYQISLGRSPTPAELDQALNFLHSQAVLLQEQASHGQPLASPRPAATAVEPAAAAAWVDFCLAMLNCDEFLVIP